MEKLICPQCASNLLQPAGIDTHGAERWELGFGCPECGWAGSGVYTTTEIEEIEEELDRGYDELVAGLAHLVMINMSDYVDRFVSALTVDAIDPMDF